MTDRTNATVSIERVDWFDDRAVAMRALMDAEMHERYDLGSRAASDAALSERIDRALAVDPSDIIATVLAIDSDGSPIGHAAIRLLRGEWEVKRVIVSEAARGRGVAVRIMNELQVLAEEAGEPRLILQTGDRQPEAVALYTKLGYTPIAIYEPYIEAIPFSLCFEKVTARAGHEKAVLASESRHDASTAGSTEML